MDNWSDEDIKGKILHKMARFGKFEASHTSIENLQKGFPSHLVGRVKDMIDELRKENILIYKKTGYGTHVSINLEEQEKVMEYIEKFLKC